MKTKTLILVVEGLSDDAHKQAVLSELHSVTGITQATISETNKIISVTYDADTLHSGQQIIDAITKSGVEVL